MRQLRQRGHTFPGIALSGYGQEEDIRRSYEAGFAAHLTKPASREAVVQAIAAVTAGSAVTSTVKENDWTRLLAWLPIPLLLALIAGLWVADLRTVYESRTLMVLLNVFFTWLASLCICFLTARGFLGSGQPGLLMFGCGSLLWGVTSLAAAVIVDRVNPTITVHNLGVLGAAFCHLVGSLWRGRLPRPGRWLVAGLCGRADDCGTDCLGGDGRIDPSLLRARPWRHSDPAGCAPLGHGPVRLGRVADDLQIPAAIRDFLLLVWAGPGVGRNGADGGHVAVGPRRDPGLDESAYAISRQRLPVHCRLDGGAGNRHVDVFALRGG